MRLLLRGKRLPATRLVPFDELLQPLAHHRIELVRASKAARELPRVVVLVKANAAMLIRRYRFAR